MTFEVKFPNLKLLIDYTAIDDLKLPNREVRRRSEAQQKQLQRSIAEAGFILPVVKDDQNRIVVGSGRVQAAKALGYKEAPCICVTHLTPEQLRLLTIADNKLAENADWNNAVLKLEIQELTTAGLDMTIAGFEMGEIDLFLQDLNLEMAEGDPADLHIASSKHATVSKLGDLWVLGEHRLICGDTREPLIVGTLMGADLAVMTFNDPPYNVPIHGHVTVDNNAQHDEFAMGVGEMSEEEFTLFLMEALNTMSHFSVDGSLHYTCIDWRHIWEMSEAGRAVFSELKNICVWDKGVGGMGSLYRSQHEFVVVFKKGAAPHINNVQLGKYGRYRTNVWTYPGVNALGAERQETLAMHPTVKPTAMIEDAILDCTNRGDIVLDGFTGSGTTILAAERSNRRARCVEIDPTYVDVAIGRWERLTGEKVTLASTGQTFAEVAAERGIDISTPVEQVEAELEALDDAAE